MASRGAAMTRQLSAAASLVALVLSISPFIHADEHQQKIDQSPRWSRQISNTNFLNDWVPVQPNNQPVQAALQQPAVQTAQQARQPNGRVLNFGPPYQQAQALPQQQQHQPPFAATIFHNNLQPAPAGVSFAHEPFPHRLMFHHQAPNVQYVQQTPLGASPSAGVPPAFLLNGVVPPMILHAPVQHQAPQPDKLQNFQYQHFGAPAPVPVVPQHHQQQPIIPPTHATFLGDVSGQHKPRPDQLIQNVIPSSAVPQILSNGIDRPQSSHRTKPSNNKQKDQDEVQLLYVPLDTLYQQQRDKNHNPKYNVLQQPVNPLQINNLYSGSGPTALPLGVASPTPTPTPKPTRASRPPTSPSPTPYGSGSAYRYSTTAASYKDTPTRLKPHQPPLAMFMLNEGSSRGTVGDVLSTLARANSIDVLDSPSSKSPKVFVGPSGLHAPEGYSKFELPYLSNIEQTRLERQIDKLPFFVAPLSYRAPNGFAKIPLPAPHVGSVVVNSISDADDKPQPSHNSYQPTKAYYQDNQNQYYTTPKENLNYITLPSPSPLSNSQVRSTTASNYTPAKYKYGFSFGADDFTTTPRSVTADYFVSSTPTYATKSPSTRHSQRVSRPTAAAHTTRDELTEAPTDSSYSPQQNSEIFSYKPFPPTPSINEEYFNVNKQPSSTFSFSQFPANGTSITTQVFGNVNEGQSPSFGSFINHYDPSTSFTQDLFNQPAVVPTTTSSPSSPAPPHSPVKYTFPSIFDDVAAITTTPKPTRVSTTRAHLPSIPSAGPTVVPIGNNNHDFATQSPVEPEVVRPKQNYYKTRVPVTPSPIPQVYETDSYDNNYNNNSPGSSTPGFLQDTVLYNRERNTPATENYLQATNPPIVTTPRTTFTFYTAASVDDEDMGGAPPAVQPIINHKFVDSAIRHKENSVPVNRFKTNEFVNTYTSNNNNQQNVRYEIPKYQTTFDTANNYYQSPGAQPQPDDYSSQVTTPAYYEPTRNDYRSGVKLSNSNDNEYNTSPNYQLPSELPAINPNLPGLVNDLMSEQQNGATTTTTTAPPPTTRRGPTRARRPPTQRTTTQSPSDDEGNYVEVTTRRNPPRSRRPVATYAPANRTASTRTPATRGSQRVRYNPSPEERQRYRTRTRNGGTADNANSNSGKRVKEEENIDYQRDVLKQNYPVINREDRTTTTTTERLAEFNDPGVIYQTSERTVDPPVPADISSNNLPDQFASLQDNMQIPQQYQGLNKEIDVHEISNYPPVFFSRDTPIAQQHQQPESQTPNAIAIENTERTVVITPTTPAPIPVETTQPEVVEVPRTRRPSFIRRPHTSPTTTTTPASIVTTTPEYEATKTKEKYQARTKQRYETNSSQPRLKTRIRSRRPTTEAPTTTTPSSDDEATTRSYRKVNRLNKDLYNTPNKRPLPSTSLRATVSPSQDQKKPYGNRQSSRFSLDTEESQWSSKLGQGQNSFQPLSSDDELKTASSRPEPEIVTIGYGDSQTQETYSFNVEAKNVFGAGVPNEDSTLKVGLPEPTRPSTEASIADLIKAAISDFSNDIPSNINDDTDADEEVVTTTTQKLDTTSASSRSDTVEKKGRRRGVWKRVRVRPIDAFETAESQNIGKQIYNTILSDTAKETFDKGAATKNYQSYELSQDSKNNRGPIDDDKYEEVTVLPSPGDIDLGTGKPEDILFNGTFRDATTTEKVDPVAVAAAVSTQEPEASTVFATRDEVDDDDATTIIPTQPEYKIKEVVTSTVSAIASTVTDAEKESIRTTESNDSAEDEQPKWTETPSTAQSPNEDEDEDSKSEEQTSRDVSIGDQDTQPSIYMDEVRQKLSSLFSFPDEPVAQAKELVISKNFKRSRGPSYTEIERNRAAIAAANELDTSDKEEIRTTTMKLKPVSIEKTILHPVASQNKKNAVDDDDQSSPPVTESSFHRDLMDSVVYATSTSTEISHETEICYRGRCVKSMRKP